MKNDLPNEVDYEIEVDGLNERLRVELVSLRESTGMNRKKFAEYFNIPYRTMTDWERGERRITEYVLRLMAYKVEQEKLSEKK